MEKDLRVEWIDIIKGIAIILVVIGHACIPAYCNLNKNVLYIYLFINSINMPIFFYLSGYIFFKKYDKIKNTFKYIIIRSKKLIVPYLLYGSGVYLFINIISRINLFKKLLIKAGYVVNFSFSEIIVDLVFCLEKLDKHIWFMYILFFVTIITLIIVKFKFNNYMISMVFIILWFIYNAFIGDTNDTIAKILYYYLFFNMYKLRKNTDKLLERKKLIISIFVILEFLYIYGIDFWNNNLTLLRFLRLIIAIISIYIFLFIGNYIYLKGNLLKGKLIFIGKNSFVIYLWHQPFIVSGVTNILYILRVPVLIALIISSILGIIIPLIIKGLYEKIKLLMNL